MMLGVVLASLLSGAAALEEVRAAVFLPSDPEFVASIPKVMPVLELAAERVAPLLPGRRLVFFPSDDNCEPDLALRNAFTAKLCPDDVNRLHVFFGPTCEYAVASVSRLLKYWQTPLLTTGALTFDFSANKTSPDSQFHLLVRVGLLSFADMARFIITLLDENRWSKVALVYQRNGLMALSGKFTSKLMMETLVEFLKIEGINYRAYDLEKNNLSYAENFKMEIGNEYAKGGPQPERKAKRISDYLFRRLSRELHLHIAGQDFIKINVHFIMISLFSSWGSTFLKLLLLVR